MQAEEISIVGIQNPSRIPSEFFCPITFAVIGNPYIDPDGYTYERSAIVDWVQAHGTSPINRNPLTVEALVPNRVFAELLKAYPYSDCQILEHFETKDIIQRGNDYFHCKEYDKAFRWYLLAANRGSAVAEVKVGLCFAEGKGVPRDYLSALHWYEKASAKGNDIAMCNIGNYYRIGDSRGVKQDFQEAFSWYRRAAENGNASAMFYIGKLYEMGRVVSQNYSEAFKWYNKAAYKGNVEAMQCIAACYEEGRGVSRDANYSLFWKRNAAETERYLSDLDL